MSGHAKISTSVEIYIHNDLNVQNKAVDILDKIIKKIKKFSAPVDI